MRDGMAWVGSGGCFGGDNQTRDGFGGGFLAWPVSPVISSRTADSSTWSTYPSTCPISTFSAEKLITNSIYKNLISN